RRRVRPAEGLHQPVVATAGDHRALRAEPLRDELEGGVPIIIEPAHQPRIAPPWHPGSVDSRRHRREEIGSFGREMVIDAWRIGGADNRRIELMKLAEATLLRPLVTEC